jgi:maltooligosyltrehalose trehalohydrolase
MAEIPGPRWRHGAVCDRTGTRFQVWAPRTQRVDVIFEDRQPLALHAVDEGYWISWTEESLSGVDYRIQLDGGSSWPDPASRHQPRGVHGQSRVTDLAFAWSDKAWHPPKLEDFIIYELHVGTFTEQGTFDAIVDRLPYLLDLGVTAIEILPVAQFPGTRNWGYDGVYPFAVQESYGGPRGLQRLVDACHAKGLAVVLDAVYNHLGPEGNYFSRFGPYFSDRYRTPWGSAINFDDAYSDGVRRFFVENAAYWVSEFHVDALRLDAVHGIFDQSAYPILEEITDAARPAYVIAESSLNDPRLCYPKPGGLGLDAQWNDDYHHALRTLLTGDRSGYYADFGSLEHLATALRDGFVYQGQYSHFRKRRHGRCSRALAPHQFVVFGQNHDQVGNRLLGERPSASLSLEEQKLAAAAVLLSPFLPLLFMGEEYGETAPFLYFIEHSDADLIEAVRKGRADEFASFAWRGVPPDPQSEETFQRSKLGWTLLEGEPHATLHRFYKELIRLRKSVSAMDGMVREVVPFESIEVLEEDRFPLRLLMNFNCEAVAAPPHRHGGHWQLLLDSADAKWSGPGHREGILQPRSFVALVSDS